MVIYRFPPSSRLVRFLAFFPRACDKRCTAKRPSHGHLCIHLRRCRHRPDDGCCDPSPTSPVSSPRPSKEEGVRGERYGGGIRAGTTVGSRVDTSRTSEWERSAHVSQQLNWRRFVVVPSTSSRDGSNHPLKGQLHLATVARAKQERRARILQHKTERK